MVHFIKIMKIMLVVVVTMSFAFPAFASNKQSKGKSNLSSTSASKKKALDAAKYWLEQARKGEGNNITNVLNCLHALDKAKVEPEAIGSDGKEILELMADGLWMQADLDRQNAKENPEQADMFNDLAQEKEQVAVQLDEVIEAYDSDQKEAFSLLMKIAR